MATPAYSSKDGEMLSKGVFIVYEVPMLCGIWMEMRSCGHGDSMCMDALTVTPGLSYTLFVATTRDQALSSHYSWQESINTVGPVVEEGTMGERITEQSEEWLQDGE
jgi:hypothetical protein